MSTEPITEAELAEIRTSIEEDIAEGLTITEWISLDQIKRMLDLIDQQETMIRGLITQRTQLASWLDAAGLAATNDEVERAYLLAGTQLMIFGTEDVLHGMTGEATS